MGAVSTAKSKRIVPLPSAANREPQQGRSRASYERMLSAAEKLMIKKGNDDFTLNEVARVGKVSIGSIYLRFDSKDDLIRVIHSRVLERIATDQAAMLGEVIDGGETLEDFVDLFVDRFAESLRQYSPVLRPMMLRATYDPLLSGVGRDHAIRFGRSVQTQLLTYADQFARVDHQRLVENAFRVIYSTIARFLGLGSSPEAANEGNWEDLKQDLAIMCAAFLRAPDHRA